MENVENRMNARSFVYRQDKFGNRSRLRVPLASAASRAPDGCLHLSDKVQQPELTSTPLLSDQLLRHQASVKSEQGDRAGAIEILNRLISANPTRAIDYNNRGLVYFQSGQMDEAIADYNRALELNPKLASAYNNRGNCYAALKRLEEAIADYEIAIDLNPFHVRALINQGITFRELGMYDLAVENFDIALGLGQMEGYIYAERGRTYHVAGDWNSAIGDYQRAQDLLAQTSQSPSDGPSRRLRQVETWRNQLLSPLTA